MTEQTQERNAVSPEQIRALEGILKGQLDGHQQLLELIQQNRDAVRQARMDLIHDLCRRQNTVGQRLAEFEKQRLVLVGVITKNLEPDAKQPLKVDEIVAHVDDGAAELLSALAHQLRPVVEQVRHESSIVRQAADALSRHMSGVMQAVHSLLSRAQVYGRSGEMDVGAPVRTCVDVTS